MPHLILIDHSIINLSGHHYQYAVHILQAAADIGYTPVLATNCRFTGHMPDNWLVRPVYEYGSWLYLTAPRLSSWVRLFSTASHPSASVRPGNQLRAIYRIVGRVMRISYDRLRQYSFARDTARLLDPLSLSSDDSFFLPSLSHVELLGVLEVLQRQWRPLDASPSWHFLFRHDLPPPQRLGPIRNAFYKCQSANTAWRMYFYTDTDTLTEEYNRLGIVKFRTLPIPHTRPAVKQLRAPGQPLCILYLGDARIEKGYQHLPGIVRALWRDILETGQAYFVLHSYFATHKTDPALTAVAMARRELQSYPADKVRLITEPLSPGKYWALLEVSDLVILPYDPQRYAARSSGVLVEALAAGKPVLVPARTWMSRQVENAGPVGRVYYDIAEVPDILREMIKSYPTYSQYAIAFSEVWQRQHNALRLIAALREAAESCLVEVR